MPTPFGTTEELIAADRCYRSKDLVTTTLAGTGNPTSTSLATLATFNALQNYFLAGIQIAASNDLANFGGSAVGPYALGVTKQNTALPIFGGGAVTTGNVLAMAMNNAAIGGSTTANEGQIQPTANIFANYQPYGVYVPKGSSLYVMGATGDNVSIVIYFVVTLLLMPTFV